MASMSLGFAIFFSRDKPTSVVSPMRIPVAMVDNVVTITVEIALIRSFPLFRGMKRMNMNQSTPKIIVDERIDWKMLRIEVRPKHAPMAITSEMKNPVLGEV